MMNKKLSFVVSLLFAAMAPCAQKPMQYVRAGDVAVEQNKWDEAFSFYSQAYELDTTSFEVLNKYCDAARMIKNYALAERLYSRSYSKDSGKIYPNTLYYLAAMQKSNGHYEDAQRNFKKFIKKHKTKADKSLVVRAENEAESALWALNYKMPASLVEVETMSKNVNTSASEVAPVMADKFYFSSTGIQEEGGWKIYALHDNKTELLVIKGLPNDAEVSNFFPTGEVCFFSVKTDDNTKIYTATRTGDTYTDVQEVKELNNSGDVNTMPFVTEMDNKTIVYFVSNRDGGEGGMDIWMAERKADGFSKPTNLGKRINTPGDELTPSFYNGTFYFSSDWHYGFGGQDIFQCKWENGNYTNLINAGAQFNSNANDFYYTYDKVNDAAYFASNRPCTTSDSENTTCCNDIYAVDLSREDLAKEDDKNKMKLMDLMATVPVVLYFHNDEPNPDVWDTTTTLTYMQAYDSYTKLIPVYLKENTKGMSGERSEEATQITNDFFELKVNKGAKDLELFSDLLLKELQEGQSLKILVRGFASPRAKSDYNLNLTKRRTNSLVNYLKVAKDGAFLPYLNDHAESGARLECELIPFGELKAEKGVSDDLVDEKNSIYARSACLERKIEIENVVLIENRPRVVIPKMDAYTHDFGKINHREPVRHTFYITNEGNAPMYIDSIVASCGCTDPKIAKNIILPGEKVELEIGFVPFGKKPGRDEQTAIIYIRGEKPIVVTIVAEVSKAP
jgi:tetratricopeptide (TPR) repeat protein